MRTAVATELPLPLEGPIRFHVDRVSLLPPRADETIVLIIACGGMRAVAAFSSLRLALRPASTIGVVFSGPT